MSEFEPIESEEQLGALLQREDERIRKEYEGYISPEEAAAKDEKLRVYELQSEKIRIANEMGLPYSMADFLKGEDEKSIKESAKLLKAIVGNVNMAPLASDEGSLKDKDAAIRSILRGLKGEE